MGLGVGQDVLRRLAELPNNVVDAVVDFALDERLGFVDQFLEIVSRGRMRLLEQLVDSEMLRLDCLYALDMLLVLPTDLGRELVGPPKGIEKRCVLFHVYWPCIPQDP